MLFKLNFSWSVFLGDVFHVNFLLAWTRPRQIWSQNVTITHLKATGWGSGDVNSGDLKRDADGKVEKLASI